MSLVGKFVFRMASEFHMSGEIIDQITPEVFLVKWDKVGDGDMPGGAAVLVQLKDMLETDNGGFPTFEFYSSRAELNAFHEWICHPQDSEERTETASNVVKLN